MKLETLRLMAACFALALPMACDEEDAKPTSIIALVKISDKAISRDESVTFTDASKGEIAVWDWTFEGGTPGTFSGQTPPAISYSAPGKYDVTLKVSTGKDSNIIIYQDAIVVDPVEETSTFEEIAEIELSGGEGAAEISAFDPETKLLFVVNNGENTPSPSIDVVDLSTPAAPEYIESIDISSYGGGVNSLAVKNGLLAAAIEGNDKTDDGKIVVFNTVDLSEEAVMTVGALPDMVGFSPDGKYILSAGEGEPNDDYSIDPNGTISIIEVSGFTVTTLDFTSFNAAEASLEENGYRVFGPDANLAADTEPEYIAISDDSKTAWVTLQENNGVARVNLETKVIEEIFPLGFKDYSLSGNEIDPSDADGDLVTFTNWPVLGMYQPDAIATFNVAGVDYFITANEGDAREYDTFEEEVRVNDITLDPTIFPTAVTLQTDTQLGRLNVTSTIGDTDNDGDYDKLYSFGARSFTIWNGSTGFRMFDSGNDLEVRVNNAGLYEDGRSDAKGVEPESVTVGKVGKKLVAFVGLERVDAILMYDISNPAAPVFIKLLETGDAPEGLLFVPAEDSPSGLSLLIVSSEGDGIVKVFEVDAI